MVDITEKLSSSHLNRSNRCPAHQVAYSGNPLCSARYLGKAKWNYLSSVHKLCNKCTK